MEDSLAMQHTNLFIGGLNTDDHPAYLSDQEYTWALNAVLESTDGEAGSLTTELGNTMALSLPSDSTIIGSILTNTNSFVLFLVDSKGFGSIGTYDPNGKKEYTELINTKDLNFQTYQPVQGIFRLRNGCERIIYFTDRVNPFRVINLDKLTEYKDANGNWDVTRFKLNRTFNLATIDDITINNSGGSIRVGAYQFTYRYLDFDGNPTNWAPLTVPYYVSDDNSSNAFDTINGSTDIEFYTSEDGGVPATSKSIRINLTNVDTSFKYVEIGVVQSIEGLGIVSNSYVLSKKPISETTLTYLYTGNPSVETKSSIDALITDKESIETVGTIAHVNSNLYLGNTATKQYDWAGFQRAASKITTSLKVTQVKAYDANADGNPKNGANSLSFVDDEVYALGIVYIMKDGTYSPAFHIPGRSSTGNERNLVTTWDANVSPWADNTTELQATYAQTEDETTSKEVLRRFHVFNTGSATTLAYYESEQVYPKIEDCNNESIWGVDANGAYLDGKNIRYHKLPDRRSIPLIEQVSGEWYINKLGFEFSNIDLPSTDVQSYFFVQAKQTEQDRTVLDQGMLNSTSSQNGKLFSEGFQQYNTYRPERGTGAARQGGTRTDVLAYNSARTVSDKRAIPHDYVKILGYYGSPSRVNKTERYETPGFLSGRIEALVSNYQRNNVGFRTPTNSRINVKTEDMAIVAPTSFQNQFGAFTAGLYNSLASHHICFIKSGDSELSSLEISNESSGLLLTWFASLKSIRNVYPDLFSLEYIPLSGDWVPVPFDMFQILVTDPSGFLSGGDADATYISHTWMMSSVNFGLKYWGTSEKKRHFDGNIQQSPDYLISRVATKTENGKYEVKKLEEVEPEFMGINKDFSKSNFERLYYPLDIAYDYCNECQNTFPNRIYYSKKDNLESTVDNYRIFLANNYRNLDGYGEEIVQLLVDKDELYALCKNYTYYIPTRPQEVKTDASVAYIGTGAELSVPPKRLSTTTYSYGGCDNPLSVISTEFGTVWVNAFTGKIFKLSDSMGEISSIKMSSFFEAQLSSALNKAYREVTGQDYPYIWQTTSTKGVGVIVTYDPRFKRLILHKKDYTPLFSMEVKGASQKDNVIYVEGGRFYTRTGTEIFLTDTNWFKDNSYTISYSFKNNKWTSFHSYKPLYMMNDANTFYTVYATELYKHNEGKYRNFNDTYYPFEVEYVCNKPFNQSKRFESISVSANNLFSPNDLGVSHVWMYNDVFSSGKLTIKNYDSFTNPLRSEALQRNILDKFNITGFRDNSTSGTKTRYLTTYGVDRVPTAIDFNKSNWDMSEIKGKQVYIKLYAEAASNEKISIDSVDTIFSIKIR